METLYTPDCLNPISAVIMLCAPPKYALALVQYGKLLDVTSDTATGATRTLACGVEIEDVVSTITGINYGPRNTLLLGSTLVLSDLYEPNQVKQLRESAAMCAYGR